MKNDLYKINDIFVRVIYELSEKTLVIDCIQRHMPSFVFMFTPCQYENQNAFRTCTV